MWKNARSFADLQRLSVAFIRGERAEHFAHSGPLDAESLPLQSFLLSLNLAGFVSECSQPGVAMDAKGCGQRAFLTGFTDEGTARRLQAMTLYTDLMVFVVPPGTQAGNRVPVSVQDYGASTWVGDFGPRDLAAFADGLGGAALQSLADCWFVTVIDPHWGREAYLWDNAVAAVGPVGSVVPPWHIRPSIQTLKAS